MKELFLQIRRQEKRTLRILIGKEVVRVLGFLPLSFSCWRVVLSACTGSSDNHGEGEVGGQSRV